MIIKKISRHLLFSGLVISGIVPISCDEDRNKRGYEFFPDMVYSEAYETYAPNPNFRDGKTAQQPVAGTIPTHMIPYQYPKSPEGRKTAGLELVNPLEPNVENLDRGKVEYNTFCANCHGLDGRGDGNLYTSGKYPIEPPSLITDKMIKMPDGEYFHLITVGSAIMPPFASLIRTEDKWRIIMYIKDKLSQKGINASQ